MSIFFPKAAAPAPLEQVATQGGEPNVVRLFTFVNFHPRFFIAIVVNVKKGEVSIDLGSATNFGIFLTHKHTFGAEGGDGKAKIRESFCDFPFG